MSITQVSKYILQNNPVWAWPTRFIIGLGYQVHKRLFKKSVCKTLFNGKKIQLYPSCPISSQFMYAAKPDRDEIDMLRRHCSSQTYFLDIGANMGAYSIMMLDLTENIIAFEPDPTSNKRLELNFLINRSRKPKAETLALSNYIGSGFFSQEQGSPSNQLVSNEQSSLQVQVTTLDEYARNYLPNKSPILIKLDVEGEELKVIEGAQHFLKQALISGILFESFPDNYSKVKAKLQSLGYTITHITHHNYWASKC